MKLEVILSCLLTKFPGSYVPQFNTVNVSLWSFVIFRDIVELVNNESTS